MLCPTPKHYTVSACVHLPTHPPRLLPLLLEALHAFDAPSQAAALDALASVVVHAWPRMQAHAPALWAHVAALYAREAEAGADAAPLSSPAAVGSTSSTSPSSPPAVGIAVGSAGVITVGVAHAPTEFPPAPSCGPAEVMARARHVCSLLLQCGGQPLRAAIAASAAATTGGSSRGGDVGGAAVAACIYPEVPALGGELLSGLLGGQLALEQVLAAQ